MEIQETLLMQNIEKRIEKIEKLNDSLSEFGKSKDVSYGEIEEEYEKVIEIADKLLSYSIEIYGPKTAQYLCKSAITRCNHLDYITSQYNIKHYECRNGKYTLIPKTLKEVMDYESQMNYLASHIEDDFKKALTLYTHCSSLGQEKFEQEIAKTFYLMAKFYGKVQRFNEAESGYDKALEILWRLTNADFLTYAPQEAETLTDYAKLLVKMEQPRDSEEKLTRAVMLYRHLVVEDAHKYNPLLGFALLDLANLHKDNNQVCLARIEYNEAYEICDKFEKEYQEHWFRNNYSYLDFQGLIRKKLGEIDNQSPQLAEN